MAKMGYQMDANMKAGQEKMDANMRIHMQEVMERQISSLASKINANQGRMEEAAEGPTYSCQESVNPGGCWLSPAGRCLVAVQQWHGVEEISSGIFRPREMLDHGRNWPLPSVISAVCSLAADPRRERRAATRLLLLLTSAVCDFLLCFLAGSDGISSAVCDFLLGFLAGNFLLSFLPGSDEISSLSCRQALLFPVSIPH
jgi:hypothetical protein